MADERKFFTDGDAYERMMGRWSRLVGERFLDWLAPAKGLRWIDVGCGNGAFTETLIARSEPAELHAIDVSDEQIAYARKRDAAKRAQFHTGDAQALPFADASFDVAVMALVISFLPDPAKAAAEMARVVRPGGIVATYMWDIPGGLPTAPFRGASQALGFAGPRPAPGLDVASLTGMQALWQKAGLEEVETRRIDIEVSYTDFDDFWQSSTALPNPSVQFLRGLAPADVERVRDWLRGSLPRDNAGRISYGAVANAVKGRVPAA